MFGGFVCKVGGHQIATEKRRRLRLPDLTTKRREKLELAEDRSRRQLSEAVSGRVSPRYDSCFKPPSSVAEELAAAAAHESRSAIDLTPIQPQRTIAGGDKREFHAGSKLFSSVFGGPSGGQLHYGILGNQKKLLALRKAIDENPLTHRDRLVNRRTVTVSVNDLSGNPVATGGSLSARVGPTYSHPASVAVGNALLGSHHHDDSAVTASSDAANSHGDPPHGEAPEAAAQDAPPPAAATGGTMTIHLALASSAPRVPHATTTLVLRSEEAPVYGGIAHHPLHQHHIVYAHPQPTDAGGVVGSNSAAGASGLEGNASVPGGSPPSALAVSTTSDMAPQVVAGRWNGAVVHSPPSAMSGGGAGASRRPQPPSSSVATTLPTKPPPPPGDDTPLADATMTPRKPKFLNRSTHGASSRKVQPLHTPLQPPQGAHPSTVASQPGAEAASLTMMGRATSR